MESKMSFTSGGTSCHVTGSAAEDDPNMQDAVATEEGSGSQWSFLPKPSHHNYVQYLTESSAYLPKTEDMIGSNYAALGFGNDANGTNMNFFCNDPGKAYGFKIEVHSSNEVDIAKQVGYWRPVESEVQQEAMQFENTQHHHPLYLESTASWTSETIGDNPNVSRLDPSIMAGTPSFLPKPGCSSISKQKASDRQRRQRISDNLKALHDLLPNQAEGSQAYILDDIIDHVKYLQLQLKELSGRRLQAESTAIPLVFHEQGYGHYIDQQKLNEPLEEMMGKLLEENPASASQLLESNGLVLLPMDLVQDLHQSIQIFGNGTAL
ncbi:hypothetical protein PIB30_069107 [Stylosanthes scabra]|uniref:BHLH domain-containing protein n=1 Tax=Stylosanthes scabra TaxID=79078 RepID=A0ABU6UMI1_9FABA|nr:hypothetical protein [Stylosanthes scabra]